MGFRISFVRVPKGFKLRNSFKDDDDYESYRNAYDEVAEYVKHNTCTSIFQHSSNENNRLFTQIDENEDTIVGTVSKEQLYQWIIEIRRKFVSYLESIIGDADDSLIRMKNDMKMKNRRWHYSWEGQPLSMELNLKEDTDIDRMLVSDSSTYEYEIFNFISIYKNFDFEKYELVVHGG